METMGSVHHVPYFGPSGTKTPKNVHHVPYFGPSGTLHGAKPTCRPIRFRVLQGTKKPGPWGSGIKRRQLILLLRCDGAHRADISAGTAVDADVRIDGIDITLGNGALRALSDAGSASNADILSNFVSHNLIVLN